MSHFEDHPEHGQVFVINEPIHDWFGLTYANYLVLPRTLLQSMPEGWQERFVACLTELGAATADLDQPYGYHVHPVDERGRYARSSIPPYDRGRARVPLLPGEVTIKPD